MATVNNRQTFKDYCLKNKYSNWYFSIIDNAISRGWSKKTSEIYTEKHHIIPNSIVKNNDVVVLTAREHFICHLLLPKMLEGKDKYKMLTALIGMKRKSKRTQNRYINARLYDFAKIKYSEFKKEQWKNIEYRNHITEKVKQNRPDQFGKNNPMYGRVGELSPHFKKEKSKEHKDKIRKALFGMKYKKERCQKMSLNSPKNSLGKKWYHNPSTKQQKYFNQGQQDIGFILGRG